MCGLNSITAKMITHRDTWMQVKEMNRWFHLQIITGIFQNYPPIMQSFLLKFSKQISIFSNVNQWFLQTNQKVLHFYIFSKSVLKHFV